MNLNRIGLLSVIFSVSLGSFQSGGVGRERLLLYLTSKRVKGYDTKSGYEPRRPKIVHFVAEAPETSLP